MKQTRYQRLRELEGEIKSAFRTLVTALREIQQRRLYDEVGYSSMNDYIDGQWGHLAPPEYSEAWAKQTRASAKMALRVAEEFDIVLGNEAAARALRTVAHRHEELFEATVRLAAKRAYANGDELTGKYVNATINTLIDMGNTGGLVDTGDGTMTAFNAAVQADVDEAKARQTIYRNGNWSEPVTFEFNPYSYALVAKDMFPFDAPCTIEIKYRRVPEILKVIHD